MITADQLKDVLERTEALRKYLNIDQKKIEFEEEEHELRDANRQELEDLKQNYRDKREELIIDSQDKVAEALSSLESTLALIAEQYHFDEGKVKSIATKAEKDIAKKLEEEDKNQSGKILLVANIFYI